MKEYSRPKKKIHYCSRHGQALLELAVFGAFFLIILGVLLNYGLRYDLEQKTQMTGFRRGLKIITDPDRMQTSYAIEQSRNIPDPADLFGFGSVTRSMGSGSATRDSFLDAVPQDIYSLPKFVLDIERRRVDGGNAEFERVVLNTAGYKLETNVDPDLIKKYTLVYGSVGAKSGTSDVNIVLDPDDRNSWDWVSTKSSSAQKSCSSCTCTTGSEGESVSGPCDTNPYSGGNCTCNSGAEALAAIKILDSCTGNIVDYEICREQALRAVSADFCTDECTDKNTDGAGNVIDSELDCAAECAKTIPLPWYAENAELISPDPPAYRFPVLDELFVTIAGATFKKMGYVQDNVLYDSRNETFNRDETSANITTRENASKRQAMTKVVTYNNNLDENGWEIQHGTPREYIVPGNRTVESEVSQAVSEQWTTTK